MHEFLNSLNFTVLSVLFNVARIGVYVFAVIFSFHGAINFIHTLGFVFAAHVGNKNYKATFGFVGLTFYAFLFAGGYFLLTNLKFWNFIRPYFFYNVVFTVIGLVVCFYLPLYFFNIFKMFAEKPIHEQTATY